MESSPGPRRGRVRALVGLWGRSIPTNESRANDGYTDLSNFWFMADQRWELLRSARFRERFSAFCLRASQGDLESVSGYGVMETRRSRKESSSASVYYQQIAFGERKRLFAVRNLLIKQRFGFFERGGSTRATLSPRPEPPRELRQRDRWVEPGPVVTADLDRVPIGYVNEFRGFAGKRWWRSRTDDKGVVHGHAAIAGRPETRMETAFSLRRQLQDDEMRVRIDTVRLKNRFGPWGRWWEGVLWDYRVKVEQDSTVEYPRWGRV